MRVMYPDSTIVALSTAPGVGAIAVIRLSGPRALNIAQYLTGSGFKIKPREVLRTNILYGDNIIDDVLLSFFKSPNSFTGEDLVEISCHGSPYIVKKIIDLCLGGGAVLAQPGEFTKRAFINGKIDLAQAEAVSDLVFSQTRSAHKAALNMLTGAVGREINDLHKKIIETISILELELDFSDNEIDPTPRGKIIYSIRSILQKTKFLYSSYSGGKILKQGALVPIIGPPNSGKSSLLNAFLKEERAIVTPHPGTTRDALEETIVVDGFLIRLLDTAGIRKTANPIEKIGIERSIASFQKGDIVLFVIDANKPIKKEWEIYYKQSKHSIIVINKIDIAEKKKIERLQKQFKSFPNIQISAKNHTGIRDLSHLIVGMISDQTVVADSLIITNKRHAILLHEAAKYLAVSLKHIRIGLPSEMIIADLRMALNKFDEILGKNTTDDILNSIFKNFCIGK